MWFTWVNCVRVRESVWELFLICFLLRQYEYNNNSARDAVIATLARQMYVCNHSKEELKNAHCVSVLVCVCAYVKVLVCVCVCFMCMHINACALFYVRMRLCVHVCVCVCKHARVYTTVSFLSGLTACHHRSATTSSCLVVYACVYVQMLMCGDMWLSEYTCIHIRWAFCGALQRRRYCRRRSRPRPYRALPQREGFFPVVL